MRKTFISELSEIASQDKKVWLVSADIGFGVVEPFKDKHADRFLNVGIGEQNAVGMATGLAIGGQIPVVYTINSFLAFRAFEQIRMLAHMGQKTPLHCILVGTGIDEEYTHQGISHYSNGDRDCLGTLPMEVWTPADKPGLIRTLQYAYSNPGVHYIRLSRFDELPKEYKNQADQARNID